MDTSVTHQIHFHDARPHVNYRDGSIWLSCDGPNGLAVTLFLASGARAGAAHARDVAAQLIACAEEAEWETDQPRVTTTSRGEAPGEA